MSNKATVIIGGNMVELETTITRAKAALKSLADAAKLYGTNAAVAINAGVPGGVVTGGAGGLPATMPPATMPPAAQQSSPPQSAAHQARQAAAAAARAGGRGSGSGAIGQTAMQLQDVAVQAQMGTAWSTIIGQQGSQMLSAFGTKGMIAGGVVALGAALVTVGLKANEAFTAMTKGAADFNKELGKTIKVGSMEGLTTGLENSVEKIKELKTFGEGLGGWWGQTKGAIGEVLGGDRNGDKMVQNQRDQAATYWQSVAAAGKLLEVSEQQVDLQKMRSDGNDEEADKIERQIALRQKLASIDNSSFFDSTKEQLAKDSKSIAEIKEAGIAKKKAKDQQADEDEKNAQEAEDLREKEEADLKRNMSVMEKIRDEIGDGQKQRAEEKKQRDDEEAERTHSASNDMVDAERSLADSAEKRLSLTEQIALANGRVLSAEKEVVHQAKFGTEASQHQAAAALARLKNTQQTLALERAAQFVGRSSADVRRDDREEKKQQREIEKGKKRMEDAEVREADRKERGGVSASERPLTAIEKRMKEGIGTLGEETRRKSRGIGMSEVEKEAIRENVRKSLGGDEGKKAAQESAKSLKEIETQMIKLAEKIDAA